MDFRKIFTLIAFNFKNKKKEIFLWAAILFSIMFMYMFLFPYMKDMAKVKIESMPKELLQFFGMSSMQDLAEYIPYFSMIYKLFTLILSIFACTFTSSMILGEEEDKTIEFLYSQELSREEIFISKILTSIISLIILILACSIPAIICGFIHEGKNFELDKITRITGSTNIIPFTFIGISSLFSGISYRFGKGQIVSLIVVLSYMLGYLGEILQDKAEWLKEISPFQVFTPERVLTFDSDLILRFCIYLLIILASFYFGCKGYKKRDYDL